MSNRITVKHLEPIIAAMNKLVGNEVFGISKAYGGFSVYCNNSRNLFGYGHRPAREVYSDLHAYYKAMDTAFSAIDKLPTHAASLRTARLSAMASLIEAYSK